MMSSTSPFLDLYPEIRQLIYMLHLTTPDQYTPDVAGNKQNRLPRNSREYHEGCILYPNPSDLQPRNLALLLLNKQINAEISSFTDFLVNHSPSSLRYELDIDIVNEREVYPTWTLIPIRWRESFPIPVVHATFRNTGQCIRSEWPYGNAGVYPMLWNLLRLLERFLELGPPFISLEKVPESRVPGDTRDVPIPKDATIHSPPVRNIIRIFKRLLKGRNVIRKEPPSASDIDTSGHVGHDTNVATPASSSSNGQIPHIRIQELVLDVISPELSQGQSFLLSDDSGGHSWPMRNWGEVVDVDNLTDDSGAYRIPTAEEFIPKLYPDLVGKIVHPQYVVDWMGIYLNYILNSPPRYYEYKYAQYIRPRVGCISLRCDGKENHVWKLWDDSDGL